MSWLNVVRKQEACAKLHLPINRYTCLTYHHLLPIMSSETPAYLLYFGGSGLSSHLDCHLIMNPILISSCTLWSICALYSQLINPHLSIACWSVKVHLIVMDSGLHQKGGSKMMYTYVQCKTSKISSMFIILLSPLPLLQKHILFPYPHVNHASQRKCWGQKWFGSQQSPTVCH